MAAPAQGNEIHARLFDADRTDENLTLDDAIRRRVGKTQLLWVDVQGSMPEAAADELAKRLDLSSRVRRILTESAKGPHLALHGTHFHLRVMTEASDDPSQQWRWLDIVAARNHVVTVHADPIDFLRRIDERIEADASVGRLDGAAFARSILDATVTSYFQAVDAIEAEVDRIDARSLRPQVDDDLLTDLVALRRRVARLRRALSAHREIYGTLAAADFSRITEGEDVGTGFAAVAARFEDAIHSVEDSRDLLLGSFDLFMTRTAQRTNDVMKVLALATVLLLPGSLIAGLLGMNVAVPLPKDDPASFWIVLVAIGLLAAAVVIVAWRFRWIRLGSGPSASGGKPDGPT
jgi:Mg2+ and Co2+ transporter CorA